MDNKNFFSYAQLGEAGIGSFMLNGEVITSLVSLKLHSRTNDDKGLNFTELELVYLDVDTVEKVTVRMVDGQILTKREPIDFSQ